MKRLVPTIVLGLLTVGLAAVVHDRRQGPPPVDPRDRALAIALRLDSPRPVEVLDEGIRMAEALRRHYGLDTGRRHADRVAAARRAQAELRERVHADPAALRAAARRLGHDLDACANYCGDVERLARIELEREALRELAAAPVARVMAP